MFKVFSIESDVPCKDFVIRNLYPDSKCTPIPVKKNLRNILFYCPVATTKGECRYHYTPFPTEESVMLALALHPVTLVPLIAIERTAKTVEDLISWYYL